MLANVLSRRSFFGVAAGAAVAAPAIAASKPDLYIPRGVPLESMSFALDAAPLSEAIQGYASVLRNGRAIQFNDLPSDRYVYRTGHPSIDALRSVSGVHKERMERDWYPDNF